MGNQRLLSWKLSVLYFVMALLCGFIGLMSGGPFFRYSTDGLNIAGEVFFQAAFSLFATTIISLISWGVYFGKRRKSTFSDIDELLLVSIGIGFVFFINMCIYHWHIVYNQNLYIGIRGQYSTFTTKLWISLAKAFMLVNGVYISFILFYIKRNFFSIILYLGLVYSIIIFIGMIVDTPLFSIVFDLSLLMVPVVVLFILSIILKRKPPL